MKITLKKKRLLKHAAGDVTLSGAAEGGAGQNSCSPVEKCRLTDMPEPLMNSKYEKIGECHNPLKSLVHAT